MLHPEYDTLVFYALASSTAELAPGTPSFVPSTDSPLRAELLGRCDVAPYLTIEPHDYVRGLALDLEDRAKSEWEAKQVGHFLRWLEAHPVREVGYQREPHAIAGHGTANIEKRG